MPYALVGLITLGLWIFCLADLVTCDDSQVRYLPKLLWLLIVALVPTFGSLLWLVAGRPQGASHFPAPVIAPNRFVPDDRIARHPSQINEDDEEFLRRCRERAEAQRQEWKRQQREAGEP